MLPTGSWLGVEQVDAIRRVETGRVWIDTSGTDRLRVCDKTATDAPPIQAQHLAMEDRDMMDELLQAAEILRVKAEEMGGEVKALVIDNKRLDGNGARGA
jgi:Lon protease-like protein